MKREHHLITMTYASTVPAGAAAHVLGVVDHRFGSADPGLEHEWPAVSVHTAGARDQAFQEIWTSTREVQQGRYGDIVYGHDGETLFCGLHLPEADRYRASVEKAYAAMQMLLQDLGYVPFRMWNYISDINAPNADGLERYRDFCQGRAEAFEAAGSNWTADLPAATGIGSLSGGIVMCCLAVRSHQPRHFENPRQVPAYHYPREYGPRSPSFARATLLPGPAGAASSLYVSGTASVIGHQTVHPDDVEAQCDTTVDNLVHLLAHVGKHIGQAVDLTDFRFAKAYVRHAEHIPLVGDKMREAFGSNTSLRLLNVDICRSDLLVEVEGVVGTGA